MILINFVNASVLYEELYINEYFKSKYLNMYLYLIQKSFTNLNLKNKETKKYNRDFEQDKDPLE